MSVNYPATPDADPAAGESVRPERILRTRSLRDEVLIEMAHQVAADPHTAPPVAWRLEDGVLVASAADGERVWVTAIDRWDGDFLRYTRTARTAGTVGTDEVVAVLDWPTDFDDSEVIARDARTGLAALYGDVSARP